MQPSPSVARVGRKTGPGRRVGLGWGPWKDLRVGRGALCIPFFQALSALTSPWRPGRAGQVSPSPARVRSHVLGLAPGRPCLGCWAPANRSLAELGCSGSPRLGQAHPFHPEAPSPWESTQPGPQMVWPVL